MYFVNNSYFWVGLGGALGAMARVGLSALLPSFLFNFPVTILCVNAVGCFFAGGLMELMAFSWGASMNARHFLMQGLLGGFTTFSAFAIEAWGLHQRGSSFLAILYAVLSVVLSISFFFFGLRMTRLFVS